MANINGSGSAETLNDTAGDDTIVAFAGNDTIIVSLGGTDSVDGGADNDRLVLDARGLGGGINMAAPTSSVDGLSGGATWTNAQISFQHIENFTIFSSAGSFADNVTTGAGDDVFYHYGIDNNTYAADTIDLGAGTNDLLVADFSALTTHNVVSFLNFTPGHNLLTVDSSTKIDFTNVERLHLIGGALTDNVTGLDGDDILEGRGGNDMLNGAAGNDVLDGGLGDDTLSGGTGNDNFIIVNGNDNAAGGADSDTLTINYGDATATFSTNGGPTANVGLGGFDGQFTIDATRRVAYSSIEQFDITTGTGNDTITTATGNDVVHAGSGDDLVNVGAGLDSADGGIGTDRISADMSAATGDVSWNLQANSYAGPAGTSFTNFEYFGTVRTGSGNDSIATTDLQQDETIDVGGGNNNVTVRNGRDDVTAGSGTDTLVVDYSNATTAINSLGASPPAGPQPSANGFDGYFGDLTNRFVNYHGFDKFDVRTGSGNDNITMGSGNVVTNDIVSLGSGDDVVVLGRGVDVADGGIGTDGVEADFSQTATAISVDLNTNSFSGPAGTSLTNFEYFYERDIGFSTGSGNDNVVTRNAILDDVVRLGAGDDNVTVYGGNDSVVGFGLDTPAGQGGNDTLIVDYSAATNAVTRTGALQTNSGEGYDSVLSGGASRTVTFYGFDRFDITTGSGNDNLDFGGINTAANNVFHTNGGNDTINLVQSTGANFIDGGAGNDTMTGGSGNDTYVVDSASDVVNDFFGGVDTIQTDLATYSLASLTDIENLTGLGNVAQNLTGNTAMNVIDGGLGADIMTGGSNNDIYYVDNVGDQVIEGMGPISGTDEVRTSLASYTLGANVENLTGTSSAGQTLTGNAAMNVISGAGGNDVLIGGRGDQLSGNAGDDILQFGGFGSGAGLAGAQGGNGGSDTLRIDFSAYAGTVSTGIANDANGGSQGAFLDPGGTFPSNILLSFGGIEKFDLTGTAGADTLTTGGGDDLLKGGAGNDALNGGAGSDTAIFSGNRADYTAVDNGGGSYTITDNRPGADGTDTIVNFEYVRFQDGTVTVQGLFNVAPALDLNSATPGADTTASYTENAAAILIAPAATLTDDSADFGGGSLTVSFTANGAVEDQLAIRNQGSGAGQIGVSGTELSYGGVVIGTVSGGANGAALVVTFNAGATPAAAEALTHNITYVNASEAPSTLDRTIHFAVDDGHGAVSGADATLGVTAVDDAAVAQLDAFSTDEATIRLGNVFADNGSGVDGDVDGPSIVVSAVNGSGANVGVPITLASGAHLTLGANGNFSYDPTPAFNLTPAPGSGASNTPAHDSFTYMLTGGNTATVTVTVTGIDTNDLLIGTAGADTLDGGTGNDILRGLGGDDVYYVDTVGDNVREAVGGGFDRIYASADYTLRDGQEIEILSTGDFTGTAALALGGNEFDNLIIGNGGANILYGKGGNDILRGLGGNDSYYVDTVGDTVGEAIGGGFDRVYASADYDLRAGQEIEILSTDWNQGTAAIALGGNELANSIYGNGGDNILDGKGGNDILIGLGGNDNYYVDSVGDYVGEDIGGGFDRIYASADYDLRAGQEIEILSTDWNQGTANIALGGNELNNILYGNGGANILDGKGGNDILIGLGGDDNYYVDTVGDNVREDVGGGNDRIYASADYTLRAGQEIEVLSTDWNDGTTNLALGGNELDNSIYGNNGNNILYGKGGNDILAGLGGADQFWFIDAPAAGNVDTILDFQAGVDEIVLLQGQFGNMPAGTLGANAFQAGNGIAQDADDRILYDTATGALYFDADGNGIGAAVHFATLSGAPAITVNDFQVI